MAALREKPRICRYELVVPVLFSHLRNADAGVGSAPNLRSARLAHACTRVRATFERVACCFRVAFQKGNPKRAPIPRFEKEVGEPFNAVGSLALWSLKDPPRATRFLSPPPPSSPSPFCSLFSFSSTRLFFGFLLVAFAFCSRWEGIEFHGWVEWYTRNSLGIYVSPLGKISSARCFR